MYRVGPLARLNVADRISTPQADKELQEWRSQRWTPRRSSFYYHWARLIEIIYALERIEQLLNDSDICGTDILANAKPTNQQGVGIIEAPRGTLFHHYWVDENGRVEKVNLIVATGHNNLAMNRAVQSVAKKYVKSKQLQEGMLNRVEAAIRCYDPCLSCSTHAIGQMPMTVEVVDSDGVVRQTLARS
jgi:NAD-reducing hydrogenase large subunit